MARKMDGMRGRRSSGEASWVLLPPSSKLSAGCLSNPAAPRLITAVSSAHKGAADLGIRRPWAHYSSPLSVIVSWPFLSRVCPSQQPFLPIRLPAGSLLRLAGHGHSSHTQPVSNTWLSSHLSRFWSGVFLTSRYKDPRLVPPSRKNSP